MDPTKPTLIYTQLIWHVFYSHVQVTMAIWQHKVSCCLLILCFTNVFSSRIRPYTPPSVTRLTDSFPHVSIDRAFSKGFGASNVQFLSNGSMATLALDKISGYFIWLSSINDENKTLEIIQLSINIYCLFVTQALAWSRKVDTPTDSSVLQSNYQLVCHLEL